MTSASARMGLILPGDTDVISTNVAQLNANAQAIDLNVNALPSAGALAPFPTTPYDGQWFWRAPAVGTGTLYRWDAANAAWHACKGGVPPNNLTSVGFVSSVSDSSAHQIVGASGATQRVMLNTIATPLQSDSTFTVTSKGNIMMTGVQGPNVTVDVYHYLRAVNGTPSPPAPDAFTLWMQLQTINSANIGQRIPFYLSATFNTQLMDDGTTPDHVMHCIQVNANSYLATASVGIDSTTAAFGYNRMAHYNLGSNAFG